MEQLELALTLIHKLKDPRREAELAGDLGTLYLRLGQYPQGIAHFEQALALTRALKDREAASARKPIALSGINSYIPFKPNLSKPISW